MTKDELKTLKENKEIKYIYKIPCSLFKDRYLYVIVGNINKKSKGNVWYFTLDDWFNRMQNHDLLPYACSRLTKINRCKEYLNIYNKPDILEFRKYILKSKLSLVDKCLQLAWCNQMLKEYKINRYDILSKVNKYVEKQLMSEFFKLTDPMLLLKLKDHE